MDGPSERYMSHNIIRDVEVLEAFNEVVGDIQKLGFSQHVSTKGLKFTCNLFNGAINAQETFWPSEDEINSVALKIRMFIQTQDRIRLPNLQHIYRYYNILGDLQENVDSIVKAWEQLLDNTFVGIEFKGTKLTWRELFKGMLYGKLAHLKKDNYPNFRLFLEDSSFLPVLIKHEFLVILAKFILILGLLKMINEEAICRLKNIHKF
jgi:hypothetical protein